MLTLIAHIATDRNAKTILLRMQPDLLRVVSNLNTAEQLLLIVTSPDFAFSTRVGVLERFSRVLEKFGKNKTPEELVRHARGWVEALFS